MGVTERAPQPVLVHPYCGLSVVELGQRLRLGPGESAVCPEAGVSWQGREHWDVHSPQKVTASKRQLHSQCSGLNKNGFHKLMYLKLSNKQSPHLSVYQDVVLVFLQCLHACLHAGILPPHPRADNRLNLRNCKQAPN